MLGSYEGAQGQQRESGFAAFDGILYRMRCMLLTLMPVRVGEQRRNTRARGNACLSQKMIEYHFLVSSASDRVC